MKIGIGFNGVGLPIRSAIELAQKAELAGYDSVWVAEDGWITGRDAISPLACMAYLTERVSLGTNLIPVHHSRHLHLTAVTAATIDEISNGRFIIGIGVGAGWPSYPEHAHPLKLIRDAILGLRALLTGQEYELDGKHITLRTNTPIYSWDLPSEVRKHMPIYLGARGPKITQLAGELADGVIIELYVPVTEIAPRLQNFYLGSQAAGRDPESLDVVMNLHI